VALIVASALAGASAAKAAERDKALAMPASCLPPPNQLQCDAAVVSASTARANLGNASFYGFVTAGALGVSTLLYALIPRRTAAPEAPKVAVAATSRGGTASVAFAW
jgi:hypothetical protein